MTDQDDSWLTQVRILNAIAHAARDLENAEKINEIKGGSPGSNRVNRPQSAFSANTRENIEEIATTSA